MNNNNNSTFSGIDPIVTDIFKINWKKNAFIVNCTYIYETF